MKSLLALILFLLICGCASPTPVETTLAEPQVEPQPQKEQAPVVQRTTQKFVVWFKGESTPADIADLISRFQASNTTVEFVEKLDVEWLRTWINYPEPAIPTNASVMRVTAADDTSVGVFIYAMSFSDSVIYCEEDSKHTAKVVANMTIAAVKKIVADNPGLTLPENWTVTTTTGSWRKMENSNWGIGTNPTLHVTYNESSAASQCFIRKFSDAKDGVLTLILMPAPVSWKLDKVELPTKLEYQETSQAVENYTKVVIVCGSAFYVELETTRRELHIPQNKH